MEQHQWAGIIRVLGDPDWAPRFATVDAARAARERGLLERRKHDAAVDAAEATLKAAEKAREDAWVAGLRGTDG